VRREDRAQDEKREGVPVNLLEARKLTAGEADIKGGTARIKIINSVRQGGTRLKKGPLSIKAGGNGSVAREKG